MTLFFKPNQKISFQKNGQNSNGRVNRILRRLGPKLAKTSASNELGILIKKI